MAELGDWVLGTGSAVRKQQDHATYAMRVSERLTLDAYWCDPRFRAKRPNLRGSLKQAYGDNIYHHTSPTSQWHQEDSHHSLPTGEVNIANLVSDTSTDQVLIAEDFVYWGGDGPLIPKRFRDPAGVDIRARRHHRSVFPHSVVRDVDSWLNSQPRGCVGKPLDW